ncbi:rhomboid family intramembrane serine protease, partial [bacterium]|nr:rhomboid family intramembrane serine protease [bacterium]
MSPRFFAYPLLFLALLQLGPLLRRDRWWHRVQIMQWGVILIAAAVALATAHPASWLALGWGTVCLFVVVPRLLLAVAHQWRLRGRWKGAADLQEAAGLLIGGGPGRVCRGQATVWRWAARHDLAGALTALDALTALPMPTAARGSVLLGRLWLLVEHRYWERARALLLSIPDWGSVWAATQARLLGARIHAELGDLPAAWQCLQFVALSPALIRFEHQFWTTRVRVAALAGDGEELEHLLNRRGISRRGFKRFASYWRGRCVLAQGDQGGALRLLARAHALTHPQDRAWSRAIGYYLRRAEQGTATPAPPRDDAYQRGRDTLHLAEHQAAPWRALMGLGRPGPATAVILAALGLVFLAQIFLPPARADQLLMLAGNGAFTVSLHQWWRLVTALFLHGGWLHLLLNGCAFWIFGTALERAWGWWRLLLVFLVAG